MSYIIKFFVIISFLIAILTESFINLEEGREYNFYLNKTQKGTTEQGTPMIYISIEANLLLKKVSNNKYFCQIYNQTTQESDEKYYEKQFIVEMNGTNFGSLSFDNHNVTLEEITSTYQLFKEILGDFSTLTKLLKYEELKNQTTFVDFPFVSCESNVTMTQDTETIIINAEATKAQCSFTDEVKRLWGDDELKLNDTSEFHHRLYFERENLNPKKYFSYYVLKMPSTTAIDELSYELLSSNKIMSRDELEGDLMTLSNDDIINKIIEERNKKSKEVWIEPIEVNVNSTNIY